MKHLPTLSYLPGPGSCVCLATYRATRRRLHRSSWLALVVKPARLLSGGVLFSLQFRSGFVASCAVGLLLTVLGYFVAVLARGVANSAFGRACRNFQELGVSPDHRRNARVKALNSEKPSALATSETEASLSRSR